MLSRKAKCHENSKEVVEREHHALLDPRYVTRFTCGNEAAMEDQDSLNMEEAVVLVATSLDLHDCLLPK